MNISNNPNIKFNYDNKSNYDNHINYKSNNKLAVIILWLSSYVFPIMGPILILLLCHNDSFVITAFKQYVNYMISYAIYIGIFSLLSFVLIGLPFLIIASIAFILIPIISILFVSQNKIFKDPFTIQFIK